MNTRGEVESGEWVEGHKEGEFTVKRPNGRSYKAIYREGKLIKKDLCAHCCCIIV